jgi:hypothetical protein
MEDEALESSSWADGLLVAGKVKDSECRRRRTSAMGRDGLPSVMLALQRGGNDADKCAGVDVRHCLTLVSLTVSQCQSPAIS